MSAAGLAVRTAPAEPPWRRTGFTETFAAPSGVSIIARANFQLPEWRLLEVFAYGPTPARSERDRALSDAAMLVSKLVQLGVDPGTLALALAPGSDMRAVLEWVLLIRAELAPC